MSAEVLAGIRSAGFVPFSGLSERGLEAVFSGLLDIIHLPRGGSADARGAPLSYLTVLRGAVEVVTGGRSSAVDVRGTVGGPFVLPGGGQGAQITAREDSLFLLGDGDVIDQIVSLDMLVGSGGGEADMVELLLLRQARCFSTLSDAALLDVLGAMEKVPVTAGQQVVRQNAKGDSFYFIREGSAEVWREELEDDEPQCVAILGPGDSFGEEALILGGGRNATVQMKTSGVLLALGAEDYSAMVAAPSVRRVPVDEAKARLARGAQLVDVRYQDEWEEGFLHGARHIPLSDVRARSGELERGREVVVYCRSGRRSQVGAMLLSQLGYEAVSMDGGILGWPDAIVRPE